MFLGLDLTLDLHRGQREPDPWRTFLDGLRTSRGADEAALWFTEGEAPVSEARPWRSALALDRKTALPDAANAMRPERVYALSELTEPAGDESRERYARMMRVTEPGVWSAWLAIFRERADLSAADSALLSALSPHLFVAMSNFAQLQQAQRVAAISGELLTRMNIAWVSVDAHGRVDASPQGMTGDAEKAAVKFAQAANEAGTPFAANDPRHGEMIAISPTNLGHAPSTTVVTRRPNAERPRLATMLEHLWSLSPQEARLAAALACGKTLTETAPELGLTTETARNYSKRIYAKTGAKGQADLVRLLLESVAVLS